MYCMYAIALKTAKPFLLKFKKKSCKHAECSMQEKKSK